MNSEEKNSQFEEKEKFKIKSFGDGISFEASSTESGGIVHLLVNGSSLLVRGVDLPFLVTGLNSLMSTIIEHGKNPQLEEIFATEESATKYLDTFDFELEIVESEKPIETFEEEVHKPKTPEQKENQALDAAISFLGGSPTTGIVEDKTQTEVPVLEKEETSETTSWEKRTEEKTVEETVQPQQESAPEKLEPINNSHNENLPETPEETEIIDKAIEDNAKAFEEVVTEMKNYSILHKREFEDLSSLVMAGDLAVTQKHLSEIETKILQNNNLLNDIERAVNSGVYEDVAEPAEEWGKNAEKIILIHREYFRIAEKDSQRVLVKGVFDSFNAFTGVENKVELMQNYSAFLAEAIGEGGNEEKEVSEEINEAKISEGVPLPKSKYHKEEGEDGAVPEVGKDDKAFNESATMTEEEKEEKAGFVSRMEALENMLSGDFEEAPEETPTLDKIKKIIEEHGELAGKEYVASLSQDQRDDLYRQGIEKNKQAAEASAGIGAGASAETVVSENSNPVQEQPTEEVAE